MSQTKRFLDNSHPATTHYSIRTQRTVLWFTANWTKRIKVAVAKGLAFRAYRPLWNIDTIVQELNLKS